MADENGNFGMSTQDWISAGAAGLNFLSDLFNSSSQSAENEESRAWSSQENEKARRWQEEMMIEGQAWARSMMKEQNAYDTPEAQLKRLESAGINPVTFDYGNVAKGASPAGLPSAPSPANQSPVPMQAPRFDFDYAQTRLALANADKASAEAERTRNLLPGEVKIQGMTLNLGESKLMLDDAQVRELESNMQVNETKLREMDASIQRTIQETNLLNLKEEEQKIFLKHFESNLVSDLMLKKSQLKMNDTQIKFLASQISLNASQMVLNNSLSSESGTRSLLNGVLIQNERTKGDTLKLAYDSQQDEYSVTLLQNEKERRKATFRSRDDGLYKFMNAAFDDVEIIAESLGGVFSKVRIGK